jgi:hypothetical protein
LLGLNNSALRHYRKRWLKPRRDGAACAVVNQQQARLFHIYNYFFIELFSVLMIEPVVDIYFTGCNN